MTDRKAQPDVIIVGAGPAGTSAGLALARSGRQVLICEQAVFPRRKVCGGCLSGDAVMALGGLLGEDLDALGSGVQRISFHVGRRSFSVGNPGRCRIVPRDLLDQALAHAAAATGAALRFGVRARVSATQAGRFTVYLGEEPVTPAWIIWAAGPHPALPQRSGPPNARRLIGQALTITPMDGCPPPGGVALHWLRGGYVGLATMNAERCLLAWAAEAQILAGKRPWDALRAGNPKADLLQRLTLDADAGVLATAGFPIRPDGVGTGNLLLTGDAVGFEEPFSGEGIGQALRSGMAAAEAIVAGGGEAAVRQRYVRLLGRHRRVRRRTRWLSAALRHPLTRMLLDSPLPLPDQIGERLLSRIHVKYPG